MKKVLLALIIVFFISCEKLKPTNDYTIEQGFFGGQYCTWVWFDGEIAQSFKIDRDSVSKQRITLDSIKAVNFIDCIKNGKNCVVKKPKEKYKIEQGYMYGYFNTWIWYNNNLVMSYQINESEVTEAKITKDSLKASKWIQRAKKLLKHK